VLGRHSGLVIDPTSSPGPHPGASSAMVARRMSTLRRRDTAPEVAVRRLLHAAGMRYRVAWPVPGQRRRTIDIAFTRARVAVYIDGCFWHGCPTHGTMPRSNSAWWADKLSANRARDRAVDAQLSDLGWLVLRFWEHEDPAAVAADVASNVTARIAPARPSLRRGR
jgi:DNA mismatch endonuclease (patch repair protein)